MDLSSTDSTSASERPLTPFFSLSSMKSERYSGERLFRLRKNSKSPAMVCLKKRSLSKEARKKQSYLSFRSSRFCTYVMALAEAAPPPPPALVPAAPSSS